MENPSDKFILMYLLLEIIMLSEGVCLAFNSGEYDASKAILHKLNL